MAAIRSVTRVEGGLRESLLCLFAGEWWTRGRDAATVARLLDGSDLVQALVAEPEDRLVAFARAITDGVCVAVVLDVVVDPSMRGCGFGTRVVLELLDRPELAGVNSLELVCQPRLFDFYRRFGFTERVGASRLMRRTDDPALAGQTL